MASRRSIASGACALGVLMAGGMACAQVSPVVAPQTAPPSGAALKPAGPLLVDDQGAAISLRAINLGNWFLIEPWMYGQSFLPDEATLVSVLASRFGQSEADRLIELHRDNWITQRDFDNVAAAGFNAVRIPFNYRMLEASSFRIDAAGLDRLRGALDMAWESGLYVILDMHAAPGGQSTDGPSGDITQNELWTDAEAQERFVWLWQYLARAFKNHPALVGYDLLNEPFGDFGTDINAELIDISDRAIEAIRLVDPDRLILVPGSRDSVRLYGDPAARGWEGVGLTEHFYPGIFDGQPPTLTVLADFIAGPLRDRIDLATGYGVPYLLGEFNPVFERSGGPFTVRQVFDEAEALGSHAAVWAYKRLKPQAGVQSDNWYLVTNEQPLGVTDFRTASKSSIEALFSSLGTMPLATDEEYRNTMLAATPDRVLPEIERLPLTPPADDAWPFWEASDVGGVLRSGGQSVANASDLDADELTLFASGFDLFGTQDSLRLAGRAAPPDFTVSGVLDAFDGGTFAQAGVTVRASADANAPHVSLVAFPDGRVFVKTRSIAGSTTNQRYLATVGFPVGLGLARQSGGFTAFYTDDDGQWRSDAVNGTFAVGSSPIAGFVALSNREGPLTRARFEDPGLGFPPALAPAPVLDAGTNLIQNPSFELAAAPSAPNFAAAWSPTGSNMSRQVGWVPRREGDALLAYRHWEAGSASSSVSQAVSGLTPGEAYVWTVYANRDNVPSGTLAETVELRAEVSGSPTRWLALTDYDVPDIAINDDWSRLQLRFVATESSHRLRLTVSPRASGQRDGAVKFDTFHLAADPAGGTHDE